MSKDMKFSEFAIYLEKLEKTSSRLAITDILADLFKKANKDEIDKVIYLSLGILAPSFRGIVFNAADQMMIRSIGIAFEIDIKKVKSSYKKLGDLGLVSFELNHQSTHTDPSVSEVFEQLRLAAIEGGEGSQDRRVNKISEILKSVDPLSAKFITRIPLGKLRLGFSDKTIIDALSLKEKGDKSLSPRLKKAFEVMPDIGLLGKEMKLSPKPVLGIPVLPELAQRLNSPEMMIKKMGEVAVEPKFDGLRVQIHFRRGPRAKHGEIFAFTRNLHDITPMFPELNQMAEFVKADELILDSEVIGINEKTLQDLNFQETMTRRRKHNIEIISLKIPVKFCVFDILYKDKESLLDKNFIKRKEILKNTIKTNNLLQAVDFIITKDPKVIENNYKKELSKGLEGVMIKKIDSNYVPGRTGWNWVKMKQTEASAGKLIDTVDCIVMGYSVGKGKRTSFGLGQFLVGVRESENGDIIKSISKVGTGLTDQEFHELKTRLQKLKVKVKPKNYEVNKILEPDYWVTPSLVVEIAADDITKSPNHTAGLALRFPRLVKFRDDKSINEATTLKEVEKMLLT
jgi:DNA ligase-1